MFCTCACSKYGADIADVSKFASLNARLRPKDLRTFENQTKDFLFGAGQARSRVGLPPATVVTSGTRGQICFNSCLLSFIHLLIVQSCTKDLKLISKISKLKRADTVNSINNSKDKFIENLFEKKFFYSCNKLLKNIYTVYIYFFF